MPPDETSILAAVDAGIAEASAASAPTPEPTNGQTGDDGAAPDAGSPPDGDSVAGGEAPAADGSTVDGGDSAAPDGSPDAAKVPADEAKPAEPAKAEGEGAPAKVPDPINDPLPNALKKETKERIVTLANMVKEKDQELQRVSAEHSELMGAILETKANPAQYGQALEYLRMVNSPNRADQEQALAFMQQELAVMARRLGKPVPGVNMLEGHNDLIEHVSTGRLSPEHAQEIAAARAAAQEAQRIGQRQQQNEQITRQNLEAVNKGKADLTSLGKQLLAADPTGYEAKRKILVNTLKPVFATIPPNQWAATFKRAYDALPAPARPVPPPPPIPTQGAKPQGGGGNTPLRASNPAGSAAPAPKSAAEALEMGLAAAGR